MTAVEKIIEEINNELQTLEGLHGKEIFGRKVGLAFAKRVAEQAKEMENKLTFEEAVKPLMKWLCENTHPHTTAIVDGTLAQLVEGVESVKTNEFLVD